ncbi:Xanthine/uracil permease family protein [Actinidia rufa]|uniref:Xanthine/uracil permease family protein n=1 Tax=Actinidia rufa TaxID=165716 RepID=A0A7J0EFP4_9ERIC|nr:Xanthine/uracil permease family protein [Actinidia rufa]
MADISHPPMEQLQDLEYCIDSNPPWAETILLAFQNYILLLGTSVMIPSSLVPLMGGTDGDKARVIQTLLFVAGINTLLQALFGTRLPAVVGGSYAYVIPILYIINDSSLQRISEPHVRFIQTMRAIQGAMIVAASIQIILGYSQVWGLFSRFFSPLGMAPVVGLVGFGLFQRGFPALGNCIEIGIPMLLLVIGLSLYLKHVRPLRDLPIFERFPVLISVTIIWVYATILTASGAYHDKPSVTQKSCRTDKADLISTAPWFKFPYPLQWGPPTFAAGHSFAMMSAVLVSMVEWLWYLWSPSEGWRDSDNNPVPCPSLLIAHTLIRFHSVLLAVSSSLMNELLSIIDDFTAGNIKSSVVIDESESPKTVEIHHRTRPHAPPTRRRVRSTRAHAPEAEDDVWIQSAHVAATPAHVAATPALPHHLPRQHYHISSPRQQPPRQQSTSAVSAKISDQWKKSFRNIRSVDKEFKNIRSRDRHQAGGNGAGPAQPNQPVLERPPNYHRNDPRDPIINVEALTFDGRLDPKAFHRLDSAKLFWQSTEQRRQPPVTDWVEIKEILKEKYLPQSYQGDMLDKWNNLRQGKNLFYGKLTLLTRHTPLFKTMRWSANPSFRRRFESRNTPRPPVTLPPFRPIPTTAPPLRDAANCGNRTLFVNSQDQNYEGDDIEEQLYEPDLENLPESDEDCEGGYVTLGVVRCALTQAKEDND